MNDSNLIVLPGGAMILAADVLVTQWLDNPRRAELTLASGKAIVLEGSRADDAMRVIKEAHSAKDAPMTATV